MATLPLAVLGLVSFFRGRRPDRLLVGLAALSLLVIPLLLYGNPRFHVPLLGGVVQLTERVAELASDFIEPLDELSDAVTRAEQELRALRSRELDEMTERWNRYKSGYERYLRPEALAEDESMASEDSEEEESDAAQDSSNAVEASDGEPTVPNGAADNEESQPAEEGGPTDEPAPERTEEASS